MTTTAQHPGTSLAQNGGPAPVVRGHDLTRRFGEGAGAVDALRGVSVDFERGHASRRSWARPALASRP